MNVELKICSSMAGESQFTNETFLCTSATRDWTASNPLLISSSTTLLPKGSAIVRAGRFHCQRGWSVTHVTSAYTEFARERRLHQSVDFRMRQTAFQKPDTEGRRHMRTGPVNSDRPGSEFLSRMAR